MKHFFKGQWIDSSQADEILNRLEVEVVDSLGVDLKIQEVLDACDIFSKKIINDKKSRETLLSELSDASLLDEVSAFCEKRFLLKKINKELGGVDSLELKKQSFTELAFEAYSPIGTLVHITPSNSEGLSFLAVIEGLLSLNNNLVKISSRDNNFTAKALEVLISCDKSNKIAKKVGILRISSKEKDSLAKLLSVADGVSVWGGEGAVKEIQNMSPLGARFIPWGHKISFSYIDRDNLDNMDVLQKMAYEVVCNDQQACSSPQVLYLETDSFEKCQEFSKRLFEVLKCESDKKELIKLDIQQQAEITNQVELAKLEIPMGLSSVYEAIDKSFRIIVEKNPGLRPSPLFRTLIVKPLPRKDIIKILYPWRHYLQTVGLYSNRSEAAELSKVFIAGGAARVTKLGEMLNSYEGEPHDGVYALTRFMKRVRAEVLDAEDIYRLSDFEESPKNKMTGPIIGKAEFQKIATQNIDKAELFFRSGGSSGKTALSLFSYDDYHEQMKNASEGLFAAGLNPSSDRVINLFFGGGLYGGFTSFFTILENLKAVQFPMAAYENLEMVGDMIIEGHVNTLLGMPSYLIQLIKANLPRFKKYGKLEKIFYGGEHFSEKQRMWLREELGIKVIRSAAYGSVDAGPLGFQCPSCEGSVHHLLDSNQSLEILKIDSDNPCGIGEIGRLVFTSKNREVMDINRYDLGDLGCWVDGHCPCGRKTPRFELKGRSGDIFRAGGTFLNFQKFEICLKDKFDYSGELQISIEKDDGLDLVQLILDTEFTTFSEEECTKIIFSEYYELNEVAVKEKGLSFKVEFIKGDLFKRTKGSGKLVRVLDERDETC